MARLIFTNGEEETNMDVIAPRLDKLGVQLKYWPLPKEQSALSYLAAAALSDEEKDTVLSSVEHYFKELKQSEGYSTRDLIVLHEDIPGLEDILAKFESIHYHTDDEVRYIVAGKGYFGFVEEDGSQLLVEVVAGDYINVPANAEHWFTLGDSTRIKAVRYFIDTTGWTPEYTGRELGFDSTNLPWATA